MKKVLLIGSVLLLFMSALHTHVFPAPLFIDWDINNAMIIMGVIGFILSSLLIPASSRGKVFIRLLSLPLTFAILFCLFEISTEFDSNNSSKGFGIVYFIVCCTSSFIGTAFGLLMGRFIRKLKKP